MINSRTTLAFNDDEVSMDTSYTAAGAAVAGAVVGNVSTTVVPALCMSTTAVRAVCMLWLHVGGRRRRGRGTLGVGVGHSVWA